MARLTVTDGVGTRTEAAARPPLMAWRLTPLAFYLLGFLLIRGDLARLPGSVADFSLHLYFAAMLLYLGGMFFYFAYFAYRREGLRWLGLVLVVPGAVWLGQGLDLIHGSSMTGSTFWAVVGGACIVAGLGLLSWPWRQTNEHL